MGDEFSKDDEKKVDKFLDQNYDKIFQTSRTKEQFNTNLENEKIKDNDIISISNNKDKKEDFKNYYNAKLEVFSKRFDKENMQREKEEKEEKEKEELRSRLNDLQSSIRSYTYQLSQIRMKEETEKREKVKKREEFNKKEEEIKNEYFNNLESEVFQNKECISKFKAYLKVKVEEKDEEKDENIDEGKNEDKEKLKEKKMKKQKKIK